MKKVLIWDNFPLRNSGGPFGYLYNIHEYLKVYHSNQIVFLSDLLKNTENDTIFDTDYVGVTNSEQAIVIRSIIKDSPILSILFNPVSKIIRFIAGKRNEFKRANIVFNKRFNEGLNEISEDFDLNEFDYIHFHMVYTVSQFKTRFPMYKGKTILTSHCPCPWSDEMVDLYNPPFARLFRNISIKHESKCYELVDYVMFPCEGAMEPYMKEPILQNLFCKIRDKFFFVPTSILDIRIDYNKIHNLNDLGIPNNAFVITFMGRHNKIKGYDIIKNLGEKLLDKNPNLYFVCAGDGEIAPLVHPRWIELGFIDYAVEVHAQSDLYIIANRETYFDMGTIEVLRSGNHLILSNTGGNMYFKTLPESETSAIQYFDIGDNDTLICQVEKLISEKERDILEYKNSGWSNRQLYLKYFTPSSYINSYLQNIEDLA